MIFKKILLILIVVFAVSAVLLSIRWRSESVFERIMVTGNYTISREEILKAARLKDTMVSTKEIDIDIIQDRILKHPEVKKVFVSKELPSELKIEIIERRPVAILNSGNEMKLIDDELEVFPFKNYTKLYDLPVISGIQAETNPNSKNRFNKEELRLAMFLILNSYKESKAMYNNISEVNLSDSGKIIIYMSEDSSPFYFPRLPKESISNINYQDLIVNKLRVFDSYLKQSMENHLKNNVCYVDLRYSNHVVVNYNN